MVFVVLGDVITFGVTFCAGDEDVAGCCARCQSHEVGAFPIYAIIAAPFFRGLKIPGEVD